MAMARGLSMAEPSPRQRASGVRANLAAYWSYKTIGRYFLADSLSFQQEYAKEYYTGAGKTTGTARI